jgi:hypothetical protein
MAVLCVPWLDGSNGSAYSEVFSDSLFSDSPSHTALKAGARRIALRVGHYRHAVGVSSTARREGTAAGASCFKNPVTGAATSVVWGQTFSREIRVDGNLMEFIIQRRGATYTCPANGHVSSREMIDQQQRGLHPPGRN